MNVCSLSTPATTSYSWTYAYPSVLLSTGLNPLFGIQIRIIFSTALPIFIGNSVFQINKIVDGAISTGLGDGNATALSYATVLEDFVVNIIVNNLVDVLYVKHYIYIQVI